MTFRLVKSKKTTIILGIIGCVLAFTGMLFSFILENDLQNRAYYIGTPLISGMILLLGLKVFYPINDIGEIKITSDQIEIEEKEYNIKLSYADIENIRLIINGYEMELKRNWWILSREFFPYEHGHSNEIIITPKSKSKIKCRFFLNNKTEENKLISTLANASNEYNFELKK